MALFEALVVLHVATGALGLTAFWGPIVTRKGAANHRKWGKAACHGEQERERAAVGPAPDPHHGIAGSLHAHAGQARQVVDERRSISHLVVGGVHRDEAGGLAEAARGVGEHDVAGVGQELRLLGDALLAPAEAVGQQDRRSRSDLRNVDIGVELHRGGIRG